MTMWQQGPPPTVGIPPPDAQGHQDPYNQPPPYPAQGGYAGGGYPPGPGFVVPPPLAGGNPPAAGGYPPAAGGYPPTAGGYPPTAGGYPPSAGGYPTSTGYPPSAGGYPQSGVGAGNGMYGSQYGEEPLTGGGNDTAFQFSEKSIRLGFIRKVYLILMCQLVVTMGFIALFLYETHVAKYSRQHPEMWWVAFALMFVCLIALACCPDVRRKSPMNFIFLSLFTLCEGFMLGSVASFYGKEEVLMAVGITAAVCLGLTLFAFQTKFDFTACGSVLFVCLIILVVFGIITIFIPGKVISLVYASLGALLFSLYLVYDTQLMMGGKHKYSVSPEEYIFAALNLYLDIINIFLFILTIVGASRD